MTQTKKANRRIGKQGDEMMGSIRGYDEKTCYVRTRDGQVGIRCRVYDIEGRTDQGSSYGEDIHISHVCKKGKKIPTYTMTEYKAKE